jgi:hypothetical protein
VSTRRRGGHGRPWHACDRGRPPHTRPDTGPTGRAIHDLSGADAQHGVHAGPDEQREMRVGTQAPLGDEHVSWVSGRVDRLHLGEVVGEEGRDHQREEHTGARMEQPQKMRHGKAAPRPLLRRLAKRVLKGRGVGHGTS